MAGEGVTSPSALLQPSSAQTQAISVASPTGATSSNPQQLLSAGVPPQAHQPQLAVNLAQQQSFPQSQQTLNQIAFAQQQQQQQQQPKAGSAARSLHTRYVQNVQNPAQAQQPPSPAMGVQSPPQTGASSIPRSSSASRVGAQVSPSAANIRAAVPTSSAGQFVGSPTLQQQQQQQMLALQRASQNQSISGTSQRPAQAGQTPHLQTGQLPGLMGGPSSIRSVYPASYMQARTPMGGQMVMPLSPQYQQMHARQKTGQVPSTHYATAVAPGSQQLAGLGSMPGIGSQLTRPPGSVGQQAQPVNRMQPIQNRQPQNSQQSQPSSQLTQQQANTQKMPSMGSQGVGLPTSSQPPSGVGNLQNQAQQAWMHKSLNQAQTSYQAQQQHQQQGRSVSQRGGGILPGGTVPPTPSMSGAIIPSTDTGNRILGKRSIQDLVAQVDPTRRLDPEVEDMLLDIADDFIESVTTFSCKLAKHRKSNTLEAKDVLLHLSANWDLSIPGIHGDEYRPYKRTAMNELHKQRLAVVKKSLAAQPSGQDTATAKASGTGQPLNASIPGAQAPTAV